MPCPGKRGVLVKFHFFSLQISCMVVADEDIRLRFCRVCVLKTSIYALDSIMYGFCRQGHTGHTA